MGRRPSRLVVAAVVVFVLVAVPAIAVVLGRLSAGAGPRLQGSVGPPVTSTAVSAPASPTLPGNPTASPPTATASPAGAATVQAYSNPQLLGGIELFGINGKSGAVIVSPIAGRITLNASTDPSLPAGKVYGYMTITAADHTQVALFFGAVGIDDQLLAVDQAQVKAGTPLIKVTGPGPSVLYYLGKGVTPYQVMGYWRDSSGGYLDVTAKTSLFTAPGT